ncbi:MAG TPA: histidinol-phosphate transaminase [Candidatus Polarisedimenticolaceae bacterium]|nr:histidinol-phosphate transaminase [Candidatus Polarisedimenticolaceae bacterium]
MSVTRREFVGIAGAVLGTALVPVPSSAVEPSTSRPVRLDSNENPYGPSQRAQEAMAAARSIAARYPDDLEDRVADALAQSHAVPPKNVLLGCGSGEILRMADLAFLGAGRTVVAADPTFEAVLSYARVTKAEATRVPLTADFRHDTKKMVAACDDRTGLVYVCNPNNPTGTIVKRAELAALVAAVPERAVVLVDEAYHHFVEDSDYASAIDLVLKRPNVVVARTFSKIYGLAGMRLGYAVGAEDKIAAMRPHKNWSNANAAVLEAALASLDDADHVKQQRRLMNDTRRWLCDELKKDGRTYIPSETNFLMIDVGGDVAGVIEAMRARKIFVGRRFAALPNWLRVSIGTREETAVFLSALRDVVPVRVGG